MIHGKAIGENRERPITRNIPRSKHKSRSSSARCSGGRAPARGLPNTRGLETSRRVKPVAPTPSNAAPSVVGKILATLFFGAFLGIGCFFTALIGKSVWRVAETYRWTRADCEIVASSARPRTGGGEKGQRYEFAVEYRYRTGRGWLTATRWSTRDAAFERFDDAQRLAERYRPGTRPGCWRDPSEVRAVVLERESLLSAFVLLFPMIFVAVGAGGVWAVWRSRRPERASIRAFGSGWLRAFFLIFFVAGAGVLWVLTAGPLVQIFGARSWAPVPARVISSRAAAHSDSDGTAYRMEILYAYTFEGVERHSTRYDFSRGSSSGYAVKTAVVRNYPVGAATTCYVNPRRPADAVLSRAPFKALWFGAIGLVFLLVGGLGLAEASLKKK